MRRVVLNGGGANIGPLRTLCVLTSPLIEDIQVYILLKTARMALGFTEVRFEFQWGEGILRNVLTQDLHWRRAHRYFKMAG